MNTLSIFIDESGDFGEKTKLKSYYLVTMVFHDQADEIKENINKFENALQNCVFNDDCVHTGPIIRREEPYKNLTIDERRKILYCLRSFMLSCKIKQHTFVAEKHAAGTKMELSTLLAKTFSAFVRNNLEWLQSYDEIIVYYDNGQTELSTILNAIFHTLLSNVEFRNAKPAEYKLLQVADFICTMEFLKLKMDNKQLSKSEEMFFYKPQELKKSFIKSVIKIRK